MTENNNPQQQPDLAAMAAQANDAQEQKTPLQEVAEFSEQTQQGYKERHPETEQPASPTPQVNKEETDLAFKPQDPNGSTVVIPPDDEVVLATDSATGQSIVVGAEHAKDILDGKTVSASESIQPADTSGYVIEKKQEAAPEQKGPFLGDGVPGDASESIATYLKDMDSDIEKARAHAESLGVDADAIESGDRPENPEAPKNNTDDDQDEEGTDADEFDEDQFAKATIIIDKTGMGSVINLTDDERAKLETVKTITLKEVEMVEIPAIKIRKPKKGSIDKILERQATVHETPIILPASGYEARIAGCSTYELMALASDSNNPLIDNRTKWTLIHSKLRGTSIGNMDFDTFLKETAAQDYNNFIYGILVSTYPADDTVPLNCPKCNTQFNHKYQVRSLMRSEKMSDKLLDTVKAIADSSHSAEEAKKTHAESALSLTKQIQLPVSKYVVTLYVASVHDFIYNGMKALSENPDTQYQQAHILSTLVKEILIPDPDDMEYYIPYDKAADITKALYTLSSTDTSVLFRMGAQLSEDTQFEYGLVDVVCPKCGNSHKTLPFELESILFHRYQQELTTTIE